MAGADVDMEGQPIDRAMKETSKCVQEWAESVPAFGGMWVDLPTREIHIAVADPTAEDLVADLQTRLPTEIRLHPHQVWHSWAALVALHQAVSEYLEQRGYRALYSVDSGARVKTNDVRVRLKDTAPDEVIDEVSATFSNAPLRIERTTSRWTAC